MTDESTEEMVRRTRNWVEKAVIGLNLCPFAPAPHRLGLIHYAVSAARHGDELLESLAAELTALKPGAPVVLTAGNVGEQGTTNLIVLRDVPARSVRANHP